MNKQTMNRPTTENLSAMQQWMIRIMIVAALFCPASARTQGWLKASGHLIVNEKGEKEILRGMGLGGWMLQEGYMFRLSNIGQQYKIKAKISELIGPEATEKFYEGWLASHTRRIDIDSMAAWGFNSVRLPMHYRLFTLAVEEEPVPGKNTWLEKGFAMTDSLLSWCKANKMYLILDLHATPGGQGNDLNISDRDPAKPSLWESEANRQKMIALWRKLAERYAGEPWIGGYDIINEPNWGFEDPKDKRGTNEKKNEPLRQLMMDITKAIRAVDKRHIIIIEGNGFGNNYNGILPAWDDNMVLSFHKYGNFNDEAAIRRFTDLREKYNMPLWMGESGENSNTWFTDAIRLVESKDIGWAWWQLKKIGINNPLEVRLTPSYQKLLDYWNGKGPVLSATEAQSALNEFLENTRLENNIWHKDVTDAMFRQVRTPETRPFKTHRIAGPTTILAVDYDLGRQGLAYFDRDTASYQYTPGVKTVGNRGRTYRNDGVDIMGFAGMPILSGDGGPSMAGDKAANGYAVFSIEDGEWLQYTVEVSKKGRYNIGFTIAAMTDTGKISFSSGNNRLIQGLAVPATGGLTNWQKIVVKDIPLEAGKNILRVYADKGGFNLASIDFTE
ncbi:MAG TPA: cellulase family glycosylhydrolase [Puia sp.]|nr:cellulase family glycosylhydrolase [Puia sp.]